MLCSNLKLALCKNINLNSNKNLLNTFNELNNYYYRLLTINQKNENIKNMLIKFNNLLLNLKKMNYDTFITKSLNTLDLYGYGVTLIFILNSIEHIISNDLFIILMDFAIKISFIDLNNRLTIEEALTKFKSIIHEYIDEKF